MWDSPRGGRMIVEMEDIEFDDDEIEANLPHRPVGRILSIQNNNPIPQVKNSKNDSISSSTTDQKPRFRIENDNKPVTVIKTSPLEPPTMIGQRAETHLSNLDKKPKIQGRLLGNISALSKSAPNPFGQRDQAPAPLLPERKRAQPPVKLDDDFSVEPPAAPHLPKRKLEELDLLDQGLANPLPEPVKPGGRMRLLG